MKKDEKLIKEIKSKLKPVVSDLSAIAGKTFRVGDIGVEVDNMHNITVTNSHGVCITYPVMNETWVLLSYIVSGQEEGMNEVISTFFNFVAFPVLSLNKEMDKKFFDDIASSLKTLSERTNGKAFGLTDAETEELSRSMYYELLNETGK